MGLPIVENLSGLCGNLFSLLKRPQLHFRNKSKKCLIILNLLIFTYSPCLESLGLLTGVSGCSLSALYELKSARVVTGINASTGPSTGHQVNGHQRVLKGSTGINGGTQPIAHGGYRGIGEY